MGDNIQTCKQATLNLNEGDLARIKLLDLRKYADQGVDISLLVASLRKTPTQRIDDNNAMLEFVSGLKIVKYS